MKVAVIGTGHVGLTTCVTLAHLGHEVAGMDVDREKIVRLQEGNPPFHEPGLEDMLREGIEAGRLRFVEGPDEAIPGSEIAFICVGTPPREDWNANLSAVEHSAREVARSARGNLVVAEKSTVPAGTAERIRTTLRRERPEFAFEVVSNPEFLREGRAVRDALEPDRILVGADSTRAFGVMRRLYRPLVDRGHTLIETDIATAELAKHACNAFLALKVSFINAMARMCEAVGADVVSVADVMGADPRIGRAHLRAGMGYGGSCFPKDLMAFERLASKIGYDFPLLREIARINEEALLAAAEKVEEALWNVEGKRIALLGLAFTPGTDDVRFSPALELGRRLLERGAVLVGYDPQASANAKTELPELEIAPGPYEAVTNADCAVLCTEWEEFRTLDLARLKQAMRYPVMVDGRNLFRPDAMRETGFAYYPLGRAPIVPA
jgi:UDPglucose 6-dehydrogenase